MTKKRGRRRLKRILIILGVVIAVLIGGLAGTVAWLYARAEVSTVGEVDFAQRLSVPAEAKSRVAKDGTRVFDLDMRAGETEFRPGQKTPTWGFNGSYLGPTLRAERGEKVRVNVDNGLEEASTVHWHGMHLPARMDGGPHQMVEPGGSWSPQWKIDQPASTLWYHPHPHGKTEQHVQKGLAGMFILDDKKAAKLPLPDRYGVNDVPVMVQDVRFDGAKFDHGHGMMQNTGFLGDRTMVNGTLAPYHQVKDEAIRLRLLNASTARVYNFGFADDRDFALVGTDGGLLEKPAEMNRLKLSPGERAEVVVRMKPGERTVLRSYPYEAGDFWSNRFGGADDSFDVMELRADKQLRPAPELPDRLADRLEVPDGKGEIASERSFDLQTSGINGKPMKMDRIDATVTRGSTEIWNVRNIDGTQHNFHVHDVQFRILELNGRRPPEHLRGPKDTVFVPGGTTVKLALSFTGPADPDVPYMYHCHLLAHEDGGMMGQFVVVEPGQGAGKVPGHHDHH
ncbi:multicopper oxidase family protein [Streptomyces coryli]|uniref:multicopper oxidase family protein n=1 Tax=Streptomyces coryli TaxID=1128680 RepID=UPI0019D0BE66|nr:multicopper oxidase domain-containing protein [Streptomyces coryli]